MGSDHLNPYSHFLLQRWQYEDHWLPLLHLHALPWKISTDTVALEQGWANCGSLVLLIRSAEDCYRVVQIKWYHNYDCIHLTLSCNAWRSTRWRIRHSDKLTWFCGAWATLVITGYCYYSATALKPSATMSGPEKREADSECRVFNKEWTTKHFFTEVRY